MDTKRLEELKLDHLGWRLVGMIFVMLAFGWLFGCNYLKNNLYDGN